MGFFGDMFQLGKELGEIVRDGSRELKEISTDGFKEMVIKGNSDYKTSYEKRDEARSIASAARSNYESIYQDVHKTYERVSKVVEEHYQYKVKLYNRIQSEYAPTIQHYVKKFQYKKKDYEFAKNSGANPFQPSTILSISSGNMGALIGLGGFMQKKRVEEADDMLEEAKELRAKLNRECEKLKRLQANLQLAEKAVKEERSLIDRLLLPLKEKMEQTEKMLHTFFRKQDQVNAAESAIEIIKLFEKTLTTQFLQDEGMITRQYQDISKQLKIIESQLKNRSV